MLQGLEKRDALVLQELEIDACFERGLLVLQEKEQQTRNLLHQLRRNRLPFSNERYSSVLDEQIPHYLEQLSTYEGILYYSHTEEDLDYPLLDGIPLFHDMYHLHGMDLVLYYMERFALEHTFCEYFREELPEFIRRYEQQKGVTGGIFRSESLRASLVSMLCFSHAVSAALTFVGGTGRRASAGTAAAPVNKGRCSPGQSGTGSQHGNQCGRLSHTV
ncbi:MAG: DUF6179 domain-containing protein [[Clostridium] innocuum]